MKYSEKRTALQRMEWHEEEEAKRNPIVVFLEDTLLGTLFFLLFGWVFVLLFSKDK